MSETKELTVPKPKTLTVPEMIAEITQNILSELSVKVNNGLTLPEGYNPQNAIMSAFFMINNTVNKDKVPVMQSCKASSVKQAIWDMIDKGLMPSKKHVYFIAYGDVLTMIESYFGLVYRTKRADKNILDVYAQVVYEKDTIKYDICKGVKRITEHTQEPDNVDTNKIKGAYATILYKDGTEVSEYMTMQQIRTSWKRSPTGGTSDAHKDQPDMMAKRTVLKRLCNITLNTETNDLLLDENETEQIEAYADEHEATEVIDVTTPEPEQIPPTVEQKQQLELDIDMPDILKGK